MLCCAISPPKRVAFLPRFVMACAIVVGLAFSAAAQKEDATQPVVNALTSTRIDTLSSRVQVLEASNPAVAANELLHLKSDFKDLQDSVGEQRKWLYGIFAAVIGHMLISSPMVRIGRKNSTLGKTSDE